MSPLILIVDDEVEIRDTLAEALKLYGYRAKAVLTRYPEGIMLERSRAHPIWIPQESISAIRTQRGVAGKVAARNGILAIRWRLPSGTEIDLGFRGNDRSDYDRWLTESTR